MYYYPQKHSSVKLHIHTLTHTNTFIHGHTNINLHFDRYLIIIYLAPILFYHFIEGHLLDSTYWLIEPLRSHQLM